MKTKIFLFFSLCLFVGCGLAADKKDGILSSLSEAKTASHSPGNGSNGGNIRAGIGYSNDAQQVALQPCFNATIGSYGKKESTVSLSTSLDFEKISHALNIDITSSGKIDKFSSEAEMNYFRSIKNESFSYSLNYYQYFNNNPDIVVHGQGLDALNDDAKAIYGKNPYFGLICGDEYFTSFKQGAELIMSLNIHFTSSEQEQKFDAKFKGSFSDIITASGAIKDFVTQENMSGTVDIQAYQKGGDPVQLAQILRSKDPSGSYYVLTCSLKRMDDCTKAANGLLAYASDIFPTQFNVDDQKGLVPLGIGFSETRPIEFLGLKPAESLLTPQILQERKLLSTELDRCDYYQQKLYALINGYPVAWDEKGAIYKTAKDLYDRAVNNIGYILSSDHPNDGARRCFDVPNKCDATYNYIESQIKPIAEDDLKFMDPIKYYYRGPGAFGDTYWYFNGNSWGYISDPTREDQIQALQDVNFNDTNASLTFRSCSTGPGGDHRCWTWHYWNGALQEDGVTLAIRGSRGEGDFNDTFNKKKSPFYFDSYQQTE